MPAATPSNSATEIALYKQRLDELYDLVEAAVRRAEPGSSLSRTTPVQIDEQLTGPYSVPSLEVSIPGKSAIRLVPRGIYNIGARGRVDARSRLGRQILVWVEAGGPVRKTAIHNGDHEIESATRPVFAGVPEGWAWTDDRRVALVHLTEQVFIQRVLPDLVA